LYAVGHPVTEAATGARALALAREMEPALVVLDVHLPDISGYEVCRELRATFGDQLPIVFLSGARTESYDRVGGLLLGADDYLTKPFAHDELLARVRRLLERSTRNDRARRYDLTAREQQVLAHLAAGHPAHPHEARRAQPRGGGGVRAPTRHRRPAARQIASVASGSV
jgi:DNA-binding response OmpR family regulator